MANLRPKHQAVPEPSGATAKLIRQTRQATQKRYTAEEKIRIVMEGIRGEIAISALCRREHIHTNLYYRCGCPPCHRPDRPATRRPQGPL